MNSLDQTLERLASRPVDETAVGDAQRNLEALLARQPNARRVTRGSRWLAATASAAVAALVVVWMSFSPTPALAFSAIQQNLRDFNTLSFVIDQRAAGHDTVQTRVDMTREGNVRTEIGEDITVVVNSSEKRVLTLMNSPRIAMITPLASPVERDDQLEWLEDIREYQGVATQLPQPRMIAGQQAHGWQLEVDGLDMVIWATAEGVPLEMSMNQGAQIDMVFRFKMNQAMAADLFSTRVPDGYSLAPQED
jgi:hypothetical protein